MKSYLEKKGANELFNALKELNKVHASETFAEALERKIKTLHKIALHAHDVEVIAKTLAQQESETLYNYTRCRQEINTLITNHYSNYGKR